MKATVVSLPPLCSGEHESKSLLSVWSLKMMLKSKQAKGMDEDAQGHFFKSSVTQVRVFLRAPVLAIAPERHSIWIFRANVLDFEILCFPRTVKKYCRRQHTEDHWASKHRDSAEGRWADRQEVLTVCQAWEVLGSLRLNDSAPVYRPSTKGQSSIPVLETKVLALTELILWGNTLWLKPERCWDVWQEQREITILTEGQALELDVVCVPDLPIIC